MPQRKKISVTNVRRFIEVAVESADEMLKDNGRWPNGLVLPPAYVSELREMSLVGRAILKKHAERNKRTGQRKDVYVEAPEKE